MYPRPAPLRFLSLIAVVLAAVLTTVFAFRLDNPSPRPGAQAEAGERAGSGKSQPRGWGAAVGFASRERWLEHYGKHGAEFGRIDAEEYLRRAQALRDAAPRPQILEAVRGDGVITRYDRDSGAFIAVNRNGTIRTFFRPNDGERYFQRQKDRGG